MLPQLFTPSQLPTGKAQAEAAEKESAGGWDNSTFDCDTPGFCMTSWISAETHNRQAIGRDSLCIGQCPASHDQTVVAYHRILEALYAIDLVPDKHLMARGGITLTYDDRTVG